MSETPAEMLLMYRRRCQLTQSEQGSLLGGLNSRAIRNWESGYSLPRPSTILKLIGVYLDCGVFVPGREMDEMRLLWQRIKASFDHSTERVEAYAVFDEREFLRRLDERKSAERRPCNC